MNSRKPETRSFKLNPDGNVFYHRTLCPAIFSIFSTCAPLDGIVIHHIAISRISPVYRTKRIEVRNRASGKWIINCFKLCCGLHFLGHIIHRKDSRRLNTTHSVVASFDSVQGLQLHRITRSAGTHAAGGWISMFRVRICAIMDPFPPTTKLSIEFVGRWVG